MIPTLFGVTYSEDKSAVKCNSNEVIDEVEGDIDPQLTGLAQDDPIVIEALKNYYLDKPNDFPRNLARKNDPVVSLIC